jgi:hypothetical protein
LRCSNPLKTHLSTEAGLNLSPERGYYTGRIPSLKYFKQNDIYRLLNNGINYTVSGRVGGMVYVVRKDTNFVRKWVKPADPKTAAQRRCRKRFAMLMRTWQSLPEEYKAAWRNYVVAKKKGIGLGHNAFISVNIKRLRADKSIMLAPVIPGYHAGVRALPILEMYINNPALKNQARIPPPEPAEKAG